MAEVKPTRSELLKLKKKIKLATSGHSLLKRKRDGLIQELFALLEKAKKRSTEINERYVRAQQAIDWARATEGSFSVHSTSFAIQMDPNLHVKGKTVMGVAVPEISFEADHFKQEFHERGYGVIGTTPRIDEAAKSYEELLHDILIAAEIETTMKKLLVEIDATKRRVNALEFTLIPRMTAQADFIKFRLDEMEREDIFRLKRFKATAEKREEEAA